MDKDEEDDNSQDDAVKIQEKTDNVEKKSEKAQDKEISDKTST